MLKADADQLRRVLIPWLFGRPFGPITVVARTQHAQEGLHDLIPKTGKIGQQLQLIGEYAGRPSKDEGALPDLPAMRSLEQDDIEPPYAQPDAQTLIGDPGHLEGTTVGRAAYPSESVPISRLRRRFHSDNRAIF